MLAATDRFDCGILNIFWCWKIRLADAKGNDVLAFALKFVDFGKDDERIFGAE